ncbi:MAG: DUF2490 domain-containing protein [Acidobacteria bacterium]|nr:DUF2490 domain-containing protein [Acidobacteriota bacterium]
MTTKISGNVSIAEITRDEMQRSGYLLSILFLVLALSVPVKGQNTVTPPREDNQFWNETQIVKHLNEKRDLVFIGVIRLGRDWHRPVDERAGLGYAFKVNPHLTIMPTYLFVSYQPFPGRLINEHRLVMNVTGKFSLRKFTFTDRNLFERRVRHSNPDFTVYRNRLQIDHPARIGNFEFKPFIADEVWYSTQTLQGKDAGWFRNRISVGILKQFTKHFYGEFFYLHQHDGVSRPGNIPVVGTLFKYTL